MFSLNQRELPGRRGDEEGKEREDAGGQGWVEENLGVRKRPQSKED
jgi:hypothetical protein